jgi:hypothetical protein
MYVSKENIMEVKEDPVLKRVKEVIEHGAFAIGQQQFIDLCYGDRLQTSDMIRAYCYDCMGFYEDGIEDCKNDKCPLYSKMPYNSVLSLVPALDREKNRNVARNTLYPMGMRLKTVKSKLGVDPDTMNRGIRGSLVTRKLKPRKYPQEITQKEISREEREIALFDNAIAEYEKEKTECKEPK